MGGGGPWGREALVDELPEPVDLQNGVGPLVARGPAEHKLPYVVLLGVGDGPTDVLLCHLVKRGLGDVRVEAQLVPDEQGSKSIEPPQRGAEGEQGCDGLPGFT